MARAKKPENETEEQSATRHMLEQVSNNASRSEKTSWNRKMDNMVKLITRLTPIEEEILTLMTRKMVIIDAVGELRITMVNECVHPYEHLVEHENHIHCKFCDKKINLPAGM